jgi:hypothetical protein
MRFLVNLKIIPLLTIVNAIIYTDVSVSIFVSLRLLTSILSIKNIYYYTLPSRLRTFVYICGELLSFLLKL